MIVELVGGLTSRLDVLASLAHSKDVQFVWEPAPGINAEFRDLFDNDLPVYRRDAVGHSHSRVLVYDSQSTLHVPELRNVYLKADWPVRTTENEKYGWDQRDKTYHPFSQFLLLLRPVKYVRDAVERCAAKFGENIYGINIRRGVGVNYHASSCIFSPTNLFLDKVREKGGDRFFVATDSCYDLEQLCIHFLDRLVFIEDLANFPVDGGYTSQGVQRALADWYLLAKTSFVYMTKGAGFAQRACRLNGVPYEELVCGDAGLVTYYDRHLDKKQRGLF